MKQEDKDILLKDLCARLPYETMCATTDNDGSLPNIWEIVKSDMLNENFFLIHDSYEASTTVDVKEVRPYLFPLSSIKEEQYYELQNCSSYDCLEHMELVKTLRECTDFTHWPLYEYRVIDWFNKNHVDYRGLIEKGLAIDAKGLNIY